MTDPGEEVELSSGIAVTVTAFPAGLYRELNAKALRDHPDPAIPKKVVQTVTGPEEVDDADDPEYLKKRDEATRARASVLGEAVLDFCVRLDLSPHEGTIRRMEKYSDPLPQDPDDRRVAFLERYAMRGAADYKAVTESALLQMMVTDKEVRERLKFFRREVARPAPDDPDAPGPAEDQWVDVQAEDAGA